MASPISAASASPRITLTHLFAALLTLSLPLNLIQIIVHYNAKELDNDTTRVFFAPHSSRTQQRPEATAEYGSGTIRERRRNSSGGLMQSIDGSSVASFSNNHAVEVFRTFMLQQPAPMNVPYIGIPEDETYFSQVGQDKAIDDILNKKRNGFFIEVGAYDGVSYSNSLFFERNRNWTGLLIEANPRAYRELLMKDRKAWTTPACISLSSHVELSVDFLASGADGGVGKQKQGEKDASNPYIYMVKANCFPLNVMLDAIGQKHVDMFSLDVEGSEMKVLESIDWDRVTISLFTIEVNKKGREIDDFLTAKGYRKMHLQSSQDAIYFKG